MNDSQKPRPNPSENIRKDSAPEPTYKIPPPKDTSPAPPADSSKTK